MAEQVSIALVGSESLLGREIRDLVANSSTHFQLRLIADDSEEAGALTRVGDEPAYVTGLSAESLEGARAVILAGSAESSRKALELVDAGAGTVIIDLTYATEEMPEARLRAPLVEEDPGELEDGIQVIAHPAAIAAALFLRRVHENDPIRQSVLQIFAPASELGTPAVEELQKQVVSLLSFQKMPQEVFDTQLGFNLLARYGAEAQVSLEDTELRIERHLATLLAPSGAPMPSLRLIQAPVFHGHTISAWVEFEGGSPLDAGVEVFESNLAAGFIEVRGADFEPPTNVGQAGQSGIAVGAIAPDRNNADAGWFWIVADNLRLAAENAVALVRQIA